MNDTPYVYADPVVETIKRATTTTTIHCHGAVYQVESNEATAHVITLSRTGPKHAEAHIDIPVGAGLEAVVEALLEHGGRN
jgi:hypothetical protein